jgi:hypothetical protein
MQTTFGGKLVSQARRCWDLTAAVPQEHEAALWKQGDELVAVAALFGDEEAERHEAARKEREADRSCDQREFWEISAGF